MEVRRAIWRGIRKPDPAFFEAESELYNRVRDFGGVIFALAAAFSLGEPSVMERSMLTSVHAGCGWIYFCWIFVRLLLTALLWHFYSRTHIVLEPRASINSALAMTATLICTLLPMIALYGLPLTPIVDPRYTLAWLGDGEMTRQAISLTSIAFFCMGLASLLGATTVFKPGTLEADQIWRLKWNAISSFSFFLMLLTAYLFRGIPALVILIGLILAMLATLGSYMPQKHDSPST